MLSLYQETLAKASKALFFLITLLSLSPSLDAKIRLITFHYNEPRFIEMQAKLLRKFMKDDYELIVFNDAKLPEHEIAIANICDKLGIPCHRFEQHWHLKNPLNDYIKGLLDNPDIHTHLDFKSVDLDGTVPMAAIAQQPSIRHCHVIQYALDHYGYCHDDIVVLMDGDIFPIRPIRLRKMMAESALLGIQRLIKEENIDYLWVPFIAFDPRKIPTIADLKFHADVIQGKLHDSGAHTYHFLKANPHLSVKKYLGTTSTGYYHWTSAQIRAAGFSAAEAALIKNLPWPQSVEFHLDKHLLHYGASSFELEGHQEKTQCVMNFINKISL